MEPRLNSLTNRDIGTRLDYLQLPLYRNIHSGHPQIDRLYANAATKKTSISCR